MNIQNTFIGIMSLVGTGTVAAHGASYEHTHTLLDAPGVFLCLIVSVGVAAATLQSLARPRNAVTIETEQRHDRND